MTPSTRHRRPAPTFARLAFAPLAVLALLGLADCSGRISSTSDRAGATPKAMAACRQRADQVYDMQNRADVYRSDMFAGGQRDAPFGATGVPGNASTGLSARYARETMIDDCLNGLSVSPAATADAQPAATTPAATMPTAATPTGATPTGTRPAAAAPDAATSALAVPPSLRR